MIGTSCKKPVVIIESSEQIFEHNQKYYLVPKVLLEEINTRLSQYEALLESKKRVIVIESGDEIIEYNDTYWLISKAKWRKLLYDLARYRAMLRLRQLEGEGEK